MAVTPAAIPNFDDLPPAEDMRHDRTGGKLDNNGFEDHLGCPTFLMPVIIRQAYKEARDGVSISLNWSITAIPIPGYLRQLLVHNIIDFKGTHMDTHSFDDELHFDTKCSRQWESLVHYAHQPTGLTYNGSRPTKDSLVPPFRGNVDEEKTSPTLGH